MTSKEKKKVLFVCTHNSARSQMAEGLLQASCGNRYEGYSGGTEPSEVSPCAVRVMGEMGIDLSHYKSKNVLKFIGKKFDHVVTVCDQAQETCPFFPGTKNYMHKGFQDPSQASGTDEEILAVFRRVRDELKAWIEQTFCQH